jgi:hypothetical protein
VLISKLRAVWWAVIMSGEDSEHLPKWAAGALIVGAVICWVMSLVLACFNMVAAATLTAGLFVACVLFVYLPKIESLKGFGFEAKLGTVVRKGVLQTDSALASIRTELKEIKNQLPPDALKETAAMLEKCEIAVTQATTSNNAVKDMISVIDPTFSATRRSD